MKAGTLKPESDTSGVHLWLVLWKAFRSVETHAHRHIASLDMCLSDFAVLEVLLHKGPVNVQELGAKVMLTSGSMTAALDRLERRGLIERKEDSKDRRARLVRLTKTGLALIQEAFEDHKQAMERAVAGVEAKDREVLIALLRQLGLSAAKSVPKVLAVKSGGKRKGKE